MLKFNDKDRGPKPRPAQGSISVGTEFVAEVRDISAEGKGVVQHPDGQIFFVPGVWLAEQVRVRVVEIKGRFGLAELVFVIEASPDRVPAPCVHQGFGAGSCGGCPWQFVRYEAQMEAKQRRVNQTLVRLAEPDVIKPILASPKVFGYRNRAQFKTDGSRLGYLAASSRNIADVQNCLILTDRNQQTLQTLRQSLPRNDWQPRRKDRPTTLDIDENTDAATVSVNARLPFQQANDAQNAVMRNWLASKLAALEKNQVVLELFAGSGNFTEVIVNAGFDKVIAVEVVEPALTELRARLPGVTTQVCDLFAPDAAARLARHVSQAGVLVLDPPRDGLKNDGLKSSRGFFNKKSRLRDLFYISCNLATFARDVQSFVEQGFKVAEVQPVDQFPHTPHIELMAHLHKR